MGIWRHRARFRVLLPDNFMLQEGTDGDTQMFKGDVGQGIFAIIVFRRLSVTPGASSAQLMLTTRDRFLDKLPSFNAMLKTATVKIAQRNCAWMIARYDFQGNRAYAQIIENAYVVDGSDGFIIISSGGPRDRLERLAARDGRSVYKTFRILTPQLDQAAGAFGRDRYRGAEQTQTAKKALRAQPETTPPVASHHAFGRSRAKKSSTYSRYYCGFSSRPRLEIARAARSGIVSQALTLRFTCEHCQAKYAIADDRIENKVVKIKCQKCGHDITVRGPVKKAEPEAFSFDEEGREPESTTRIASLSDIEKIRKQATEEARRPVAPAPPPPPPPRAQAVANWMVLVHGTQRGPFNAAQIAELAYRRSLNGRTYVCARWHGRVGAATSGERACTAALPLATARATASQRRWYKFRCRRQSLSVTSETKRRGRNSIRAAARRNDRLEPRRGSARGLRRAGRARTEAAAAARATTECRCRVRGDADVRRAVAANRAGGSRPAWRIGQAQKRQTALAGAGHGRHGSDRGGAARCARRDQDPRLGLHRRHRRHRSLGKKTIDAQPLADNLTEEEAAPHSRRTARQKEAGRQTRGRGQGAGQRAAGST